MNNQSHRLLSHLTVDDLAVKIRLTAKGGYPYDVQLLRDSLSAEQAKPSPRKKMILLLDGEIRRQIREARRAEA